MEAHPPLVGLGLVASVELLQKTNADLNAELSEVLADGVGLLSGSGLGNVTTEGELGVTGESKVLLQSHSSDQRGSLLLVLLHHLVEACRDVQDAVG